MPFLTFSALDVLTAADMTTLSEASTSTVTAGTRPGSPVEGQPIYETDTDELLYYNGVAWRRPWRMPWGVIATATKTGNQNVNNTLADISSLSVTFTAVANRYYKISGLVNWNQQAGTGWLVQVSITDGSNVQQQLVAYDVRNANDEGAAAPVVIVTPAAGSVTYKLRGQASVAACAFDVVASATRPSLIIVEDIGPNGAPA